MALVMPHSIFIHIPNTGGSWVRTAVRAAGIRCREVGPPGAGRNQVLHCGIKDVPKHLRWPRLTFFCIRHPVSWLKSRWSYAIQRGKLKVKTKRTGIERALDADLNVFIENVLATNASMPSHAMLYPVGWKRIDGRWQDTLKKKDRRIGRTESLISDLRRFLFEAGEKWDDVILSRIKPQRVSDRKSKQRVSRDLARRVCAANQVIMGLGHYDVEV